MKWAYGRNPDYDMRNGIAGFIWASWDCANFASQTLHAGGISFRGNWYNYKGDFDLIGRRTDNRYTTTWTTAKGLAQWLRSSPDVLNKEFIINPATFSQDVSAALGTVKVGDLIGWSEDVDGKQIHHFGIITKIENGKIYYSAHTENRYNEELTVDKLGGSPVVIFAIKDDAK